MSCFSFCSRYLTVDLGPGKGPLCFMGRRRCNAGCCPWVHPHSPSLPHRHCPCSGQDTSHQGPLALRQGGLKSRANPRVFTGEGPGAVGQTSGCLSAPSSLCTDKFSTRSVDVQCGGSAWPDCHPLFPLYPLLGAYFSLVELGPEMPQCGHLAVLAGL